MLLDSLLFMQLKTVSKTVRCIDLKSGCSIDFDTGAAFDKIGGFTTSGWSWLVNGWAVECAGCLVYWKDWLT